MRHKPGRSLKLVDTCYLGHGAATESDLPITAVYCSRDDATIL